MPGLSYILAVKAPARDVEAGLVKIESAARAAEKPPLAGLRVLDFSHAAAGPYATMFLADLGAEIIKVEKPGRGDGARFMGEPLFGPVDSDYYVSLNRGKKSVLIDLASEAGRDLARRLASHADIVLQNFRPEVMPRLGLGYEDLRKERPGLIYCSISAFGSSGPWVDRPGNDIILQAVSGLMGVTGEVGGGPVRVGAPICDFATGLFAMVGVLSALYAREAHPEGQHVEVAMLDASVALMANYIPAVATLGRTIPRLGRGHPQIVPYEAFRCSDDQYVMVGAFTNAFWRRLCEVLEHSEWIDDPRFAANAARLEHREELFALLREIFGQRRRDDWLEILGKADVPASPVYELSDAIRSEQAIHNQVVQRIDSEAGCVDVVACPIHSDRWATRSPQMPPTMGAQTDEILGGLLGLDQDRIESLIEAGVIARGNGKAIETPVGSAGTRLPT